MQVSHSRTAQIAATPLLCTARLILARLTAVLLLCIRADKLAVADTAGQEFWRVGLQNCRLDNSAPTNTVFRIPFVVFDTEPPFSNATVDRVIVLTSPCDTGNSSAWLWHAASVLMLQNNELPCTPAAGFFDCPSGCFKLTCRLVELVTNATKPVLSLSTAMAGLAGGSGRLLIEYGSSAGVALLPCSSQGEPWCACAKQHSLLKTWPVASIPLDNVGCLQVPPTAQQWLLTPRAATFQTALWHLLW